MLTHRRRPASIAFVGLLLLGLGFAGCATAPVATPAVPRRSLRAATLDEVLAAYEGYCKGNETLSASGDLDVRDLYAGKARKLGVRVLAARGGRLYLKGSVSVVTALEVVSNGDRFWFQVPSKKTVWTGDTAAPAQAEDEGAPYYALRPRDVTAALLPEPLAPGAGDGVLLEADPETFSLTLGRPAGARGLVRRRVWLDRQDLRPVRLRSYDERGDLQAEAVLTSWKDGSPRKVEIARPAEGYEAVLTFDKVERNVSVPERAFQPRTPEGYTVVEVRD